MKRMNLDIWAVGKLNQLFLKGSRTEAKFSKIKEKKKKKKSYLQNYILFERYSPLSLSYHWLLVWQSCIEMMPFQS